MYTPAVFGNMIVYKGIDNDGVPLFFESKSKTTLAQYKEFNFKGDMLRVVTIQSKNSNPGDTLLLEVNGVRVLDRVPLFQSCSLDVGSIKVNEFALTVFSETTNSSLEVQVLIGLDII